VARAYRLWMEKDAGTGKPINLVRPLTKKDEQMSGDAIWRHLAGDDPSFPLGGPWQVLLRLLNRERRIPSEASCNARKFGGKWYADLVQEPDWDTWKAFCQEAGVPYLLTEDQGHPH